MFSYSLNYYKEDKLELEKIINGIKKTGFKLEFDVSQLLLKNSWNVINNKYYIDDLQESVREIDLVAYKATDVNNFYTYTVLIISCKKNENGVWALLSKERDPLDPNIDWLPVHAWSNNKALDYIIKNKGWKDKYLNNNDKYGSNILSKIPDNHIFAFQEIDKSKGSPKNDKNIFNSIVSLMKAQAYEMNALPERKKVPCVFQFNLISIVDAELARVDFSDSNIDVHKVEEEVYVADYIINKKQTSAKIHFVQSSYFGKYLKNYESLHKANVLSFKADYENFYSDITQDYNKQEVFLDDIKNDMYWRINIRLRTIESKPIDKSDISLWWNKKENVLELGVFLNDHEIKKLNADTELINQLQKTFKKYFHYEGQCIFSEGIPF